jgi:fructose-bisphosphate aldolase class II
MPLTTIAPILKKAQNEGYGVGAFNFINMETLEGIITAAESLNSPLILGVPERLLSILDLNTLSGMALSRIERSPIPIALHLDHSKNFANTMKAIRFGFSSVMFDGSALSFEENIAQTRRIVEIAHAVGVSVEGEVGYVGRDIDAETLNPDLFTKVEQAVEFVEKTGVDALAISYGSVHGIYKGTPHLDFERLNDIRHAVDVPLVLHGGSGLSDNDFIHSIELGISKINIFTDISEAGVAVCRDMSGNKLELALLMDEIRKKTAAVVEEKIKVFGSAGKAW